MKKHLIKITLIPLLLIGFTLFGQGEKKKGKVTYKIKMAEARHQYLNGNKRGALNIYRELLKDFSKDGMINYRIGECHFGLKNHELEV